MADVVSHLNALGQILNALEHDLAFYQVASIELDGHLIFGPLRNDGVDLFCQDSFYLFDHVFVGPFVFFDLLLYLCRHGL